MAAHLRPITIPKCRDPLCSRKASVALYNTFNALVAEYCLTHGKRALDRFIRDSPEQGR